MPRRLPRKVRLNNTGRYTVNNLTRDDYWLLVMGITHGMEGGFDTESTSHRQAYRKLHKLFMQGLRLDSPGTVDEQGRQGEPITRTRRTREEDDE